MNSEHVHLIRSNLSRLSECTTNFHDLVRELVQLNVITISDKEELESLPASKRKFSELYVMLFRKGSTAFEKLLLALRSTDNEAAYAILTGQQNSGNETQSQAGSSQASFQDSTLLLSNPQASNNADFTVAPEHVTEICSILENSSTLRSNWNVIRRLLLIQRDLNELETDEAIREPGFYEILTTTLCKWIEANGREATFESLLAALRRRGETRIAEELSRAQADILARSRAPRNP